MKYKLFSLDWFKSEKQRELEDYKLEEQKLKNLLLEKKLKTLPQTVTIKEIEPSKGEDILNIIDKPYNKIKLVNNVLTIVLLDGSIISKPNATAEDFQKARNSHTEEELFQIATSSEKIEEKRKFEEEVKKVEVLIKGIDTLKGLPDFVVEGDAVYMKGVKRSMPQLLVEKFASIVNQYNDYPFNEKPQESVEYQSLKKFWLKCCLNPNAQSAEDLYEFLSNHQFKIDKHGNFYAYRRVVSKGTDNQKLVEFVSNNYNKIKAIWKKKPSDYVVIDRPETGYVFYKIGYEAEGKIVGNLQDLYLNLPNMQEKTYTSAHTGKEDYRVGSVISMPRNDGDDNNNISCSKGFHAASKKYDYSGFGDTPILVIINPMDVLAVPRGEVGKLRTSRWFFASTLTKDEQYILDDPSFDVTDLGDEFEKQCMIDMEQHIKNGFAEEVKRHTFSLPKITASEINNIVLSLSEMSGKIADRVVSFDEEQEEVDYWDNEEE